MEPLEPTTSRSARLALVAVGLLALLLVVAFATRTGFGGSSNAAPSKGYVSYAFTAFLVVFVLMIPIAAYVWLMQAREGVIVRKSFRSRLIQNIATVAFFGLIAFVILYIRRHHGHFNLNPRALKNFDAARNAHQGGKAAAQYEPTIEWPVIAIAIIALTAGGVVAYRSRRRRTLRTATPLAPTVAEDFVATISDAIGDLEAEPDARRAVIAAYARMEGVLARHGMRRRSSETPVEYLRRVLGDLTSRSDAVTRLTSLFEEAKFSRHEIDDAMKRDAIDALRAIRDDLQETSA
jgi:Domain of unknown function (DUF4129)